MPAGTDVRRRRYRIRGLSDPGAREAVQHSLLTREGVSRARFAPGPEGTFDLLVEAREGMAWVPGLEWFIRQSGGEVIDQAWLPPDAPVPAAAAPLARRPAS